MDSDLFRIMYTRFNDGRYAKLNAEQFFNISRAKIVEVFGGCCQTFAIRNLSDQPIAVQESNVILDRV